MGGQVSALESPYFDKVEEAVEDKARLEELAAEIESSPAIDDQERQRLLGNCDRYLDDLALEDEAHAIDEFDDDLLARAEGD